MRMRVNRGIWIKELFINAEINYFGQHSYIFDIGIHYLELNYFGQHSYIFDIGIHYLEHGADSFIDDFFIWTYIFIPKYGDNIIIHSILDISSCGDGGGGGG